MPNNRDPWESIEARFPINSRHMGLVKSLTAYGAFVELSEGILGMVHVTDLSWTRRLKYPSDYTKIGDKLEVVVLSIDSTLRKIQLGHKQIEESPWKGLQDLFAVGALHEGTILCRDDKGATISFPNGLEAFAPNKYLPIEHDNGQMIFRVIEFSPERRRVIVSYHDGLV